MHTSRRADASHRHEQESPSSPRLKREPSKTKRSVLAEARRASTRRLVTGDLGWSLLDEIQGREARCGLEVEAYGGNIPYWDGQLTQSLLQQTDTSTAEPMLLMRVVGRYKIENNVGRPWKCEGACGGRRRVQKEGLSRILLDIIPSTERLQHMAVAPRGMRA